MPTPPGTISPSDPVLFAYDGSELAGLAIGQAAKLVTGREALVVCVWQPVDVGFVPISGRHFDADQATEVRAAAEETAAHGTSVADEVGFHAEGIAVEAAPTWKGIIDTAEQRHAGIIVMGSHRREGLAGHLLGSVAAAVVTHSSIPVLIVHNRS